VRAEYLVPSGDIQSVAHVFLSSALIDATILK